MVRKCVCLLFLLFLPMVASAQIVGKCVDEVKQQSFSVFQNGLIVQDGFPANQGVASIDPSGQTFLRLPSTTPTLTAFFDDWSSNLIVITPTTVEKIGYCTVPLPQQPWQPPPPPPLTRWGVQTNAGLLHVPSSLPSPDGRYTTPLMASQDQAQQCLDQRGSDQSAFADCMVRTMVGQSDNGQKALAVYDCARENTDRIALGLCVVGALGGQKERVAAQQLTACYQQYGENWQQYALCMAQANTGGEPQKILKCVQQQTETGDIEPIGVATCYGASKLGLNTELQVTVECAVASGGEPFTFAGCTGGRLASMEIEKCAHGVGGSSGCFGPNNFFLQALKIQPIGPNNTLLQAWNTTVDNLQHGPGPNNDGVKALRTIGNDLTHGPGPNNTIVRVVDHILPGFRF